MVVLLELDSLLVPTEATAPSSSSSSRSIALDVQEAFLRQKLLTFYANSMRVATQMVSIKSYAAQYMVCLQLYLVCCSTGGKKEHAASDVAQQRRSGVGFALQLNILTTLTIATELSVFRQGDCYLAMMLCAAPVPHRSLLPPS